MELYDWLLALHVLSAFSWIAAMVLYSVVIVAGWRQTVPSDVVRLFRVARVGDPLIAVGMLGTIIFGVWLALDEYEIWDGWIIAAFALWLVAAAIGGRVGKVYAGSGRRGPRRLELGAERHAPVAAGPLPPRTVEPHRPRPAHRDDLQAGGLMLAAVRPDSWNLPLLLHVLGASIVVGALVTALAFQVVGWARGSAGGALQLARAGFYTLLCVAVPGWILMRVGADWIWREERWDDVDSEPAWLGIGWITSDLGGVFILVATILAGLGARRLRLSGEAASTLVRIATVLTALALIAYVVTVWAMSAKPD